MISVMENNRRDPRWARLASPIVIKASFLFAAAGETDSICSLSSSYLLSFAIDLMHMRLDYNTSGSTRN